MQTDVINWFDPPPPIHSKYDLAFWVRTFAVHLLCCCISGFTSWAPSVWLGSIYACAILMQCLISSNLKVIQWHMVSPMLFFASSLVSHQRSSLLATTHFQKSCHFLLHFSFSYIGFAFFFSPSCFFAGGWLLLKPKSSSDMWIEFPQVWMDIPDLESEAIDLDLNMEAKKRWK